MKVGVLFPGYGSQFVGMGKDLYDESRVMQEFFEEASSCLDRNFVKLCFASSDAELSRVENAYVSIFLTSVALYEVLKEKGLKPSVVGGYGIGSYAASYAAGAISFPDALYLLAKYSAFYEAFIDKNSFSLLRVAGCCVDDVRTCIENLNLKELVFVSSYEARNDTLVSGKLEDVDTLYKCISNTREELDATYLSAEYEVHSPLVDDVITSFKMYLEKVDFNEPKLSAVSPTTGKVLDSGDEVRAEVMRRINSPQHWQKLMAHFADCDAIVLVGPGITLESKVRRMFPDKKVMNANTQDTIEHVAALLCEVDKQSDDAQ